MFPKKNKLPSFQILQVLKTGKYYSSPFFKLVKTRQQSGKGKQKSKFSVIIPRKVIKKASEKNKLKRQIKAILKLYLIKLKNGYNVLVMVNQNIINKKFSLIKNELYKTLQQADLLD